MKKTLLALSIIASFAGVAHAQSSVTVYGLVDAGIVNESNGDPAGNTTRLDSGVKNGSRLGFKGKEDLGSGLYATFVLEAGLLIDTGGFDQGNTAFGRQSFVGVGGEFGELRMGRQKTVSYDVLDNLDPFHIGLAGDASRIISLSGKRVNNAVTYWTPNMSGFLGEVSYGFGEVVGNSSASRQFGLMGSYSQGPVYAALTYINTNDATGNDNAKTTLLGGTYNFDVAKLHMSYSINKGAGTLDTRDFMIGGTVPFGVSNFLVSYIKKTDKFISNADTNQFALGYTYSLSKRTTLYTSYSREANDNLAKYNVKVAGATDRLFNFGMQHTF